MKCNCFGATTVVEQNSCDVTGHHATDRDPLRDVKQFSYKEIRSATDDFHFSRKIGRGGFGTVYKGTLKNGRQVAVKTLSAQSKQGAREFLNEIYAISKVKHPNLVELIGCCVQGAHRILVYEFVENNSLDQVLLGSSRSAAVRLDWGERAAICLGIAKGLTFLHEEVVPRIVHRDIKASNILLDRNIDPKIGDFGLAKLFPDNITHISTRIAGTTGYLAPEYALGGQLTMKADVYSYGVLILEIICGRSCSKASWGGMHKLLLEWAWELYEQGKMLDLVDPELRDFSKEEVIRHVKIAFFCTQGAANRRPSMSQVVDMLSSKTRINDKLLNSPGFSQDSDAETRKSSMEPTSYHTPSSHPSITEVKPR